MDSQRIIIPQKSAIQQKAIQRFPFTLNNQTYFSSECYFDKTIINGISLQAKQARGISNQQQTIDYLSYSNRLIFYVGANILTYNTYKRKYEIVSESFNLICLKATSLSTAQKQYVIWIQKQQNTQQASQGQKNQYFYIIYVYDMNSKQKVYKQKFNSIKQQLKSQNVQIIAFMHPFKVLGISFYNQNTKQTEIVYKKMSKSNQQTQFSQECLLQLPFKFKKLRYDLQSNSYFFVKNQQQIWALQCSADKFSQQHIEQRFLKSHQNLCLQTTKVMSIVSKKLPKRKIIQFALSQAYLLILVQKENSQRCFQFYSLFTYSFMFSQIVWNSQNQQQYINKGSFAQQDDIQSKNIRLPINRIQFYKNFIIGLKGNSLQVAIFTIYQQNLRLVRNSYLNLTNCFNIQRIYINPFSSQAIILSRHYELEGTITTAQKSTKIIVKSETRYKNFYLQVSSFFLTMENSFIQTQKMQLHKRNYGCILTAPWLSQFLIQTENSFKSKNWEQKFDSIIRCSAIHPTGQYVAIGFTDSFKIYFLTFEGLVSTYFMQNVKECISLSYSKSGNDFAAATNCNIYIYDCYDYSKKQQINLGISYRIQQINYVQGYQNNKLKQSLQCITTTKRIVVYNADQNYRQQFAFNPKNHIQSIVAQGVLSIVQTRTAKINQNNFIQMLIATNKVNQNSFKNSDTLNNLNNQKKCGAVFYDDKAGVVIFSIGTKIYFVSSLNFQSLGCFQFQQISCIEHCRSLDTLFFGSVSGKIIAFPWPNKPINITSKIPTYTAHKNRVKKIKVSSNMFELISISDQSMYIHSLTLVHEMRKIQKYDLQRQYNIKSLLGVNFYLRAGFCLYSQQKYQNKCEQIKQNQQQAININFILPQERQKQKNGMFNKLSVQKDKLIISAQQQGGPMKMQTLTVKQKLKGLEKQFRNNKINYDKTVQKQIQNYQKKITELCSQRDKLVFQKFQINKKLDQQMMSTKQQYRREEIKAQAVYKIKVQHTNRQTNEANHQRIVNMNNFLQLAQMDQQKKQLSSNIIQHINSQISILMQRNGFLACRNINLQKSLSTKRRKIQDVKQLIQTTKQNISNLPKRSKLLMKPEDLKQQSTINKQFSETEKRYLKQTKKIIQKNKAVDVSIQFYEKQRTMLIILQKQLEKQEKCIDQISSYLMKERQEKKNIQQKIGGISEKVKTISKKYQTKNSQRIKFRNLLKQYLFQLTLFQQGVISLQKLRKISVISPQDMVTLPENIQLSIEQKKKKIEKIESSQQKVMNVMKNQRRIYSNEKRKTCDQNQDLLVNFNFLLHQNKHLQNLINDQKQKKQYCIKNLSCTKRQNRRLLTKPTPFQNFINFKSKCRMKTSPCVQYQYSR